jgi:hypothetical protein
MRLNFGSAILTGVMFGRVALAEGINCHGGANCDTAPDNPSLTTIRDLINGANDGRIYTSGQQIACADEDFFSGAICAFLQDGAAEYGYQIKALAQQLVDHGCSTCGSTPVDGNDVNNGMLTVNWVQNSCCNHSSCLCP